MRNPFPARAKTTSKAPRAGPQSVGRIFGILESVSGARAGATLSELARITDSPKTSLVGLLAGLTAEGCLLRDDSGRYSLGPRIHALATQTMAGRELIVLARSVLRSLVEATGETAVIGALAPDAELAVYLDKVESANPIRWRGLTAAGAKVPTTMDELEQVAKAIDDPNGTRAFVARGKGRAAVTQFSTYLYNFGGQWTKEGSYDAGFNTPEGLAAFDYYTRMLRLYGPRGTTNMSWEEALPLFASGQVAMYTDASTFLPTILKDGSADVVNNLGFAPMPAGPGGSFQSFFGWGLAMSAFTEKPGPSWLFLQWATSPEIVERITVNDKVVGGRSSVDFGDAFPADWAAAFKSSIPNARPQLPAVIPVSEVRDVIGVAVIAGIEGGDLQAALATAESQFNATVAASGN